MQIKELLIKIGLSDKEIAVYLYGLEVGPIFATHLAKACHLSRPNVYDVVKKLQQKGLCYQLGASYGRKVKMAEPEDVSKILIRKQKELGELELEFSKILPQLKDLSNKKSKTDFPQIFYFEGKEAIKNLFESSLQAEEKVIYIALSEINLINLLGEEFTKYYIKKRATRNIVSKTLRLASGDSNDPFFHEDKEYKREVRYLPKNIGMQATIFLYDNKVCLITSDRENIGLLLESKDYSATFKTWFQFMWINAEER